MFNKNKEPNQTRPSNQPQSEKPKTNKGLKANNQDKDQNLKQNDRDQSRQTDQNERNNERQEKSKMRAEGGKN